MPPMAGPAGSQTIRALLLGSTGIDKAAVVARLRSYFSSVADPRTFEYIDFERDYIASHRRMNDYLDADESQQWTEWRRGWVEFAQRLSELHDQNVVLGLHGAIARQLFGVRSVVCLEDLWQFAPTHMVTLIDDVYVQWHKLRERADGHRYRGQPTVSQLIEARRAELLVGDLVQGNAVSDGHSPINWLLAVQHPSHLLYRLLFSDPGAIQPVYLSFPISEPRRMEEQGDSSGVEAINRFLSEAYDVEQREHSVAAFCPLSIDELPLVRSLDTSEEGNEQVDFEMSKRWNLSTVYGAAHLLSDVHIETVSFPRAEIVEAAPLISGDVARRDYRLVKQVKALAVYCPVFNGHMSSGVRNEIQYAVPLHLPIHIYQDPEHDPDGEAKRFFHGSTGALGTAPGAEYIEFHESSASALSAAAKP